MLDLLELSLTEADSNAGRAGTCEQLSADGVGSVQPRRGAGWQTSGGTAERELGGEGPTVLSKP